MQYLRQSTASVVRVGPFVLSADLVTPVVFHPLVLFSRRNLLKDGNAEPIDLTTRTWIDVSDYVGWYNLTLTANDTDTLGKLTIAISSSYTNPTIPVHKDFMVINQNSFDALFTESKLLKVCPEAQKG